MENIFYPKDFPMHNKRALAGFLLKNSKTISIKKAYDKWTIEASFEFGLYATNIIGTGIGGTFSEAVNRCVKDILFGVPSNLI